MKTTPKILGLTLVLAALLAACGGTQPASDKTYSQSEVQAAFQKGACGTCHTIPGITNAKGVVGPDLTNVHERAGQYIQSGEYNGPAKDATSYIHESIINPDLFTAPDCPTGPCAPGVMPAKFSETLSKEEINIIVQYLDGLPADAFVDASAPAANETTAATASPASGADIVRAPTDLPGPIGDRAPTTVRIDLEAQEVVGQLADGVSFTYWTFNGKVPGPMFRVRVGDTAEVHFKNDANSFMTHSVDFHAVTGPGGGSAMTSTAPGQESVFTFQALKPGLYVYHCATPMVAEHIANGMYGMILVEPEGGLPAVDREFYVMQGEIYTTGNFGDQGAQSPDVNKILDERPAYFVLNGAVGALTDQKPLKANVGETVRIFFGVGGPNFTSSFHVIGEIFDRVYNLGSISTPPMTDVQTTLVPPGGATIVEIQLQVPGKYILVDHALARLQRGLVGYLLVEGPDAPDIYRGGN